MPKSRAEKVVTYDQEYSFHREKYTQALAEGKLEEAMQYLEKQRIALAKWDEELSNGITQHPLQVLAENLEAVHNELVVVGEALGNNDSATHLKLKELDIKLEQKLQEIADGMTEIRYRLSELEGQKASTMGGSKSTPSIPSPTGPIVLTDETDGKPNYLVIGGVAVGALVALGVTAYFVFGDD